MIQKKNDSSKFQTNSWIPRKGIKKVLLPLFFLFSFTIANSQNVVDFVISPSANPVSVGQTFTVDIVMDIISGEMDAADVRIPFDNTKLQVTNVAVPSTGIFSFVAQPIDPLTTINTNGLVRYAAGTNANFPTTDFTLISIEFQVISGEGTSTLLQFVAPSGATRNGVPIVNDFGTASINISASCTPPSATIAASSTCDGGNFDLILNAATGTAPFDLVINGNLYSNVPIGGTIATITPPSLSVFGNNTPSGNVDEPTNDAAVTLGVKFESTVGGFIKGIRFYSHATPSGIYTGQLWNATGDLLASGTFSAVTGSAWQEMLFSTPVNIVANTVYVASYHTTAGLYTSYVNGFISNDTINGPLRFFSQSNVTGGNGVGTYDVANNGADFPTTNFGNTNYFVDVLFSPANYTYELTSVTGDDGCNATGSLQTLNVTSVDCSTLPVSLLGLSASAEGSNRIVLKWATSSEQNNKGFEILRSLDGRSNWQSIGFVNGAGDSETRKDYSYADNNLTARRYYYQLKQIDFDGRYKYTAVVSANLGGKEGFALEQNFPNPFKSQETTIRFTLPRRTQVQLIVYDMNGRVVKTLVNGTRDAGTHAIPFQDNALPTGIYFYKLSADGYSDVKKMTVR